MIRSRGRRAWTSVVAWSGRLAVPLAVHLAAAAVLIARVEPALRARLETLGTVRRGVSSLMLAIAVLPAVVPLAVGLAVAPFLGGGAAAQTWFRVGVWLVVADSAWRAAIAWLLPPPTTLGEILQRVAVAPDALGRLLHPIAPGLAQTAGAVAAVGVTQGLAATAFGVALALGRHGPDSADPLRLAPWRGAVVGLSGAVVVAVLVRAVATPAAGAWVQLAT